MKIDSKNFTLERVISIHARNVIYNVVSRKSIALEIQWFSGGLSTESGAQNNCELRALGNWWIMEDRRISILSRKHWVVDRLEALRTTSQDASINGERKYQVSAEWGIFSLEGQNFSRPWYFQVFFLHVRSIRWKKSGNVISECIDLGNAQEFF